MNTTISHQNVNVEAIVKKVIAKMMAPTKILPQTETTKKGKRGSRASTKKSSKKGRDGSNKSSKSTKNDKDSSRKSTKSKRKSKKTNKNNDGRLARSIEMLVSELESLRKEQSDEGLTSLPRNPRVPSKVFVSDRARTASDLTTDISCFDSSCFCSYDNSPENQTIAESTKSETTKKTTVGSDDFYKEVASRLSYQRRSICIQGDFMPSEEEIEENDGESSSNTIEDFEAAFGPSDMRCLALVSHNGMKAIMKNFVIHHKHILKKFRLTGTQSTMNMLAEVFHDEPDICFGPACQSGPLGGDAELVALMTAGKLGGILFFQDPMSSHPHQADIQCLVRQAMVHNTLIANTPTTAMSLMQVFRLALEGAGKPELLPSFFFSLQSPTVDSYKAAQKEVVRRASCVTIQP